MLAGFALPSAAGASTGLTAPPLGPTTDNATSSIDPDLVLPTDTEVQPPAPDYVPLDGTSRIGQGSYRVNGPNVLWGALIWGETKAAGPAAGVRVTLLREQDGWRFSTITDQRGRYRVQVPDGTYALMVSDPRLPHGVWTSPSARGPYLLEGMETWNGGRGPGVPGALVIPTPQNSCRARTGQTIEGVDGFAPGQDAENTPCPFPDYGLGLDGTASVFYWGEWFGTYPETGRDGDVLSYMVPPTAASLAAAPKPTITSAKPAAVGVPDLPHTIRLSRRGTSTITVICPTTATCNGTVRLTTLPATRAKTTQRPRTLASGTLRGRTRIALRTTAAGRRLARHRTARVAVRWQPAGGTAATAGTARLTVR